MCGDASRGKQTGPACPTQALFNPHPPPRVALQILAGGRDAAGEEGPRLLNSDAVRVITS